MNRHCAFCLKPGKVSLCAGCNRRPYCSKECQKADWTPGKGGQGHKLWCSIECGEEDVDWEVKSAPGMGLGIFALRDMPPFTRIMVEGVRKTSHPAIADLMPINGTVEAKFHLNAYGYGGLQDNALYMRASRVNHSCRPNAYISPDNDIHSAVVLSTKAIRAGEEIVMAYQFFNDPFLYRDALHDVQVAGCHAAGSN